MKYINRALLNSINGSIIIAILTLRFIPNIFRVVIGVFAVLTSWFLNKSILWAIFHYIFAVWYLIYCLVTRVFANGGFMNIINYYF